MDNVHVSFFYQGLPCQFNLAQDKNAKGRYVLHAAEEQLSVAKQVLNSIALETMTSFGDLEGKLKQLKNISHVQVTAVIHDVGTKTLGIPQRTSHLWQKNEATRLPKEKEYLAQELWKNKKDTYKELKDFLGSEKAAQFEEAVVTNDFPAFVRVFEDLSKSQLLSIHQNENIPILLGPVKTETYIVTKEDLADLKQYLDDVGFSGVVYLSDAKAQHYVCPTGAEHLAGKNFCLHSIGKMFTGILALFTMPEGAFDKPLALEPTVLAALPKPLRSYLAVPSLQQIMEHRGGFGDYLGNYQTAIEQALQKREPLPIIEGPEDFLQFAEAKHYPLGEVHYSNLGILLVGLAVQRHCQEPFDQLLRKHLLEPAKTHLSSIKPDNSQWNRADSCQGKTMGGPAGGYWTDGASLQRFGAWLQSQCKPGSPFLDRLEKRGHEFYVSEDREIRHNGDSSAGSAMFSSFLDSGVTIAILSDQSDFKADEIYSAIRSNLIEQTTSKQFQLSS